MRFPAKLVSIPILVLLLAAGLTAGVAVAADSLNSSGEFHVRVFRGADWGAAVLGVLNLGLGLLILMMPLLATLVLVYAIATFGVLMGILTILAAFMTLSAQKKQVALRRS